MTLQDENGSGIKMENKWNEKECEMKGELRHDALMIWCQRGSTMSGEPLGLIMDGHTVAMGTLLSTQDTEDGFAAMLYAFDSVVDVLDEIGINKMPRAGAWVIEADWSDSQVGDGEDDWSHLTGAPARMPTEEEWVGMARWDGPFRKV